MTTIKEYKAMMEGATDAPWSFIDEWSGIYDAPDIRGAQVRIAEIVRTPSYISNAQFIAASRNIAPSLIRVIELAEEALNLADNALWADIANGAFPQRKVTRDIVYNALSEIRKLRGE